MKEHKKFACVSMRRADRPGFVRTDLKCATVRVPFKKNETADLGGPYPGIGGCHHATHVWDAVGCKPQGLPEVAADEVVG